MEVNLRVDNRKQLEEIVLNNINKKTKKNALLFIFESKYS